MSMTTFIICELVLVAYCVYQMARAWADMR